MVTETTLTRDRSGSTPGRRSWTHPPAAGVLGANWCWPRRPPETAASLQWRQGSPFAGARHIDHRRLRDDRAI